MKSERMGEIGNQDERLMRKQELYNPLQEQLDRAEVNLFSSPDQWWKKSYRQIRTLQEDVGQDHTRTEPKYPEEMREFINNYSQGFIDVLKRELHETASRYTQSTPIFRAERTTEVLLDMSDILLADTETEESHLEVKKATYDELLANDKLRITMRDSRRFLQHYSPTRNQWYESPLPSNEKTMLKGGSPRSTLKELAGARQDTIDAEFPHHDFDAIVLKNDPDAYRDAVEMGVDMDGIEPSGNFNIKDIFYSRDLDLNGCLLSVDGLYYSTKAMEAARTGHISVAAANRGIFGTEIIWHQGERLFKNRGTMRLLKTVTEGKAISFDFTPLNEQVDLGIYWLVLAKKFSNKPDAPLLLDRLHHATNKINQAPPPEQASLYSILDDVHARYPFFNMQGHKLDEVGVARWLEQKLLKQIGKKYRDTYRIPSGLELKRQPGDTTAYKVSLEDYTPDPQRIEQIEKEWESFLTRSQIRTSEHHKLAA